MRLGSGKTIRRVAPQERTRFPSVTDLANPKLPYTTRRPSPLRARHKSLALKTLDSKGLGFIDCELVQNGSTCSQTKQATGSKIIGLLGFNPVARAKHPVDRCDTARKQQENRNQAYHH